MKLNPNRIYLGDNGRCFCGAERCAGMTASATGRDLSGQPVYMLKPEDVAEHERASVEMCGRVVALACESCGNRATRIGAIGDGGAMVAA